MKLKIIFLFFLIFTSLHGSDALLSLTRTSHVLELEDQSVPYTAITGNIPILNQEGEEAASIFFIAYLKDGEFEDERPITFIFPGGPGGSCASLVICSVGPKRILTPEEGKDYLPPYPLIDNPETILPWTDLVFVDPIGTGYSDLIEEDTVKDFFSVEGDIESLGYFVRTFISYFDRWDSPKYLAGSSYGTTRCAGLCEELLYNDLSLHGIILLGSATDYSTLCSQQNHFLPDCLIVPTFAATAWYHKRFWPEKSLQEVVEYARKFAFERYAPAMLQPNRMNSKEKNAFYEDLAKIIGLPVETVKRYQGRLNEALYTTEFFSSERKILGGLDSRYIGDLSGISRHGISEDPSYRDFQGMHSVFNRYLQQDLETKKPLDPYVVFSPAVFHFWDFFTFDSYYLPDLFQRVRRVLVYNPKMKVFLGSGYYDCRTPFGATEYCFDRLDLPESYQKNFQLEYYEAGHGFIFDLCSLRKLKKDLAQFYGSSTSP